MERLIAAYNPAAAAGVMCRTMISIGWGGRLYDCDFNQMLELPTAPGQPRHIEGFDASRLAGHRITTGLHCYGCTAGAGSSCGGALVESNQERDPLPCGGPSSIPALRQDSSRSRIRPEINHG
jgi:hypothetical protein